MNNLVYIFYSKETINKIDKKINSLGLSSTLSSKDFILSRMLLELIIFILLILIPNYGILLSFIAVIFTHFLYEDILITSKIVQRTKEIEKDSKDFFVVLLLALKSNEPLSTCLITVANNLHNSFSKEMIYVLKDLNNNNTAYCLKNLKNRFPNKELKETILQLTEINDLEEQKKSINNYIEICKSKKEVAENSKIIKLPIVIILTTIIFLIIVISLLLIGPRFIV